MSTLETNRVERIGHLSQLGIDVYDPTLWQRGMDVTVLDISSRLANH
jgi:hypothetical protein